MTDMHQKTRSITIEKTKATRQEIEFAQTAERLEMIMCPYCSRIWDVHDDGPTEYSIVSEDLACRKTEFYGFQQMWYREGEDVMVNASADIYSCSCGTPIKIKVNTGMQKDPETREQHIFESDVEHIHQITNAV